MKENLEEVKAKYVLDVLLKVQDEIRKADLKHGFKRSHATVPFEMHIDEYRNYTLMIPSEKNAKNIVERHSKEGKLTWVQMIIEEVTEVAQAVEPHEKFNELIQVAALAVNAATHLMKKFHQESNQAHQ